jgi:hypothetical protein
VLLPPVLLPVLQAPRLLVLLRQQARLLLLVLLLLLLVLLLLLGVLPLQRRAQLQPLLLPHR